MNINQPSSISRIKPRLVSFLVASLLAGCAPSGQVGPEVKPEMAAPMPSAMPQVSAGPTKTPATARSAISRLPAAEKPAPKATTPGASNATTLTAVALEGLGATRIDGPATLKSAKNEWVSYVIRLGALSTSGSMDFGELKQASGETLQPQKLRVYQVLPMPVDVNRAGYVRHTGLAVAASSLPRALMPLKLEGTRLDLAQLRDPRKPTSAAGLAVGSGQDVLLWIEFLVPPPAVAGEYTGQVKLAIGKDVSTLGVTLMLYDFVLPQERRLLMVGRLEWPALVRLYPEAFEVAQPNLLDRNTPNTAPAVAQLDQLIRLAQDHRTNLIVPRLQPTAKWFNGQPPTLDWKEFDSTAGPWLNGTAFEDKVGLGYWPLPKTDTLQNYPKPSQLQYYEAAAAHFDQAGWLENAPVVLDKPKDGAAKMEQRLTLSEDAQRFLDANPRVRLQLPLEPDQIFVNRNNDHPGMVEPTRTKRLNASAPALISDSPLGNWPNGLDRPQNWLRTDLQGLDFYIGAGGNEGDVRAWAWLAFLRNARVITFGGGLPATDGPDQAADPNELAWFYPGEWFGLSEPLPTVQLKWLRRAEQDFEYLDLARQRRSLLNVLPMARVIIKPVEIQPGQPADPTYGLFTGTADAGAWATAQELLARTVLVRGPGQAADDSTLSKLNIDTLQWIEPLEKPAILARSAAWTVGNPDPNSPGPWVNLRLGVDVYNASDTTPDQNELSYIKPNAGWIVNPVPVPVPKLKMYQVARFNLSARVNPSEVESAKHEPAELKFESGFTGKGTPVKFVLPVAQVFRREPGLKIDGSLGEWSSDDSIQIGPLVKMLSRPEIQSHNLEMASTATEIYAGWFEESLYFAFKLQGEQTADRQGGGNFVDYQYRRAWGEDVCQLLIQALYEDGSAGPLLHIALKPSGTLWGERRLDPKLYANPWQPFEGGMRYKTTRDGAWRGEIAIPWRAIVEAVKNADGTTPANAPTPVRPAMVKFNFIQHKAATGESASWAGPLDFGRDENFMGVLVFKERDDPGMKNLKTPPE